MKYYMYWQLGGAWYIRSWVLGLATFIWFIGIALLLYFLWFGLSWKVILLGITLIVMFPWTTDYWLETGSVHMGGIDGWKLKTEGQILFKRTKETKEKKRNDLAFF